MKAAIVNPYFDTLGGGERYCASVALALLESGYKVDIQWERKDILEKLRSRCGIDISKANIVSNVNRGDNYDVCFWVSDGSVPMLRSRKNILHFQVPFTNVEGKTLINRMKLFRVRSIVCNSEFTKSFIDQEFGVQSTVVYPPVDTLHIKPKRKENIILYVGRFSNLLQSKGQKVLIEAFGKLYDGGLKNWKLVLAGGMEVGVDEEITVLKKLAKGYPVTFLFSPSFTSIVELFGRAKIFWSASGFDVDEVTSPQKVEHFGITIVEAMSAGAIPMAVSKGGHKEIIKHGVNGYLWNTTDELVSYTKSLITNNKMAKLKAESVKSAKIYPYDNFKT